MQIRALSRKLSFFHSPVQHIFKASVIIGAFRAEPTAKNVISFFLSASCLIIQFMTLAFTILVVLKSAAPAILLTAILHFVAFTLAQTKARTIAVGRIPHRRSQQKQYDHYPFHVYVFKYHYFLYVKNQFGELLFSCIFAMPGCCRRPLSRLAFFILGLYTNGISKNL